MTLPEILNSITRLNLIALIELNRELKRQGLTEADLLKLAEEQTKENEKNFADFLSKWNND